MSGAQLAIATAAAGATLGLLYLAGIPLASLLRGRLEPLRWHLAPALGFALLSAVAHTLGWLGVGTGTFAWPLVAALAGSTGICIGRTWGSWKGPTVVGLGVALLTITATITCLSVFDRLGYVTTVGATVDAISHVSRAEVIAESGLSVPELPPFRPFYEWAAAPMRDQVRMGDAYLLSIVSELLGFRAYTTFTPLLAAVLALTVPGIFALARFVFGCSPRAALLAATLAATSHLLAWAVYDTFLSQVVGTLLLPAVLVLAAAATREWDAGSIVLAGLALSGLFSAYPAYGIYALAAVGLLALAAIFSGRETEGTAARVLEPPLRGLLVVGLAAVTNPIAMFRSLGELRLITGADQGSGNIFVFPHFGEVFGLVCHPLAAYTTGDTGSLAIETAATVVLGAMPAYGLWALRRSYAGLASLAVLVPTVLLTLQQRFGLVGEASAYGYYKSLSPLLVVLLPLLARGMAEFASVDATGAGSQRLAIGRVRRVVATLMFVLLVGFNLATSARARDYVVEHTIVLDQATLEAASAVRQLGVSGLVLDVGAGMRGYWLGYLLKDHNLHYLSFPGHYSVVGAGELGFVASHALVELGERRPGSQPGQAEARWRSQASSEVVWSNPRFELRKAHDWPIELKFADAPFCTGEATEPVTFSWSPDQLSLNSPGRALELPLPAAAHALTLRTAWSGDATLLLTLDGAGTVEVAPAASQLRLPLTSAQGNFVFHEDVPGSWCVEGLTVADERPDSTVPVVTNPRGAALAVSVTQVGAVITTRMQLKLSGEEASLAHLRAGIHVAATDPASGHFGVWSIDPPPGSRSHQVTFDLDLSTKQARGKLDGAETIPTSAAVDLEAGTFVASLALWDLSRTHAPLTVEPLFSFSRHGDEVTVLEVHPETRRAFSW